VSVLVAQESTEKPTGLPEPMVSFSFKDVPFIIKKDRNSSSMVKISPAGEFPYIFPEKTYLNGQPDCNNPITNKEIALLSTVGEAPLLVTKDEPGALYWIVQGSSAEHMAMIGIQKINDAGSGPETMPAQTQAIVGLDFGATGTQLDLRRDYFFVAVKGNDSEFGQRGSGIALLRIDSEVETYTEVNKQSGKEEEKKRVKSRYFNPLDATTGTDNGNRAFPIDVRDENNNPININGGLAEILPNVVEMRWDGELYRLFIGLNVKTKSDARDDQGACAVLVGRVEGERLCIEPLINHELLKKVSNSIVAATGADKSVSIHALRTMKTTTGAMYLIGQGGNGTPDETRNTVFALPLVERGLLSLLHEWVFDKNVGTLASPEVTMTNSYGITFAQAAQTEQQVITPDQLFSIVGAHQQLPGTIVDMEVVRDAVWVAIKAESEAQSGLYVSHSIFDEHGRVAAWTPWQRGIFSQGFPLKFCFNPPDRTMHIVSMTAENRLRYHTTALYELKNGDETNPKHKSHLAEQLVTTFAQKEGGIQTIKYYDSFDPAFGINNDSTGLVIAGGYQKVAIVHSPTGKMHVFNSDEALRAIGAITQTATVRIGNHLYLIAGGVRGVALLVDEHGNGLPCVQQFEDYLDLAACGNYRWKKITDHKIVRKIISGQDCFFVITRDSIDRIEFKGETGGEFSVVNLMNAQQLCKATITDACISTQCAMIGTTKGMFVAAKNLVYAVGPDDIEWSLIKQLENESIVRFSMLTQSGNEHELGSAAQLYVLTGALIEGRGFVYRFYVHEGQVKLVPFSKTQPWLVNCRGFRHNLMAQGSLLFSTKGLTSGVVPMLQIQQLVQPGFVPPVHYSMSTYLPLLKGWTQIDHIILDTATGHLLMCGDGGIYLRE
jgi:hypothetical protein